MSRSLLLILLGAVFVAACVSPAATSPLATPATTAPSLGPLPIDPKIRPPASSPLPSTPHVFVIVMENTSLATALRAPAISSLAAKYQLATNYHAISSPSLPNYLALTSGTTWGIRDNAYHPLPAGGLGAQLTAAGVSWRAYMEGLTGAGCMRSPYPYALKHNPFAYYGGACPENVVPFEALEADLAGDTPSFVWITPGLCHDGHDCSLSEAGPWLQALVGRIAESPAWQDHGILFVVWDEGDVGSNVVPLIVATADGQRGRADGVYDHYSLLAAIEDQFGVERLGAAKDARPLTDLLPPRGR